MNEDFSLGKMSADARLTATFKCYEKTEQNGKIVITDTAWTEMSSGFL